jgi:tetratricopeptide (TPR) repeat protein
MDNFDNVRAAWQYAVDRRAIAPLERMAEGLFIIGDDCGSYSEIESMFCQAIAALTKEGTEVALPEAHKAVVGFLMVGQGYLAHRRGGWQEGRTLLEEGMTLLQHTQGRRPPQEAFALLYRGWLYSTQLDNEKAVKVGQESLALFAEAGDRWGTAACGELLGTASKRLGDPLEAKRLLQEALRLSTEIKASRLCYSIVQNLLEVLLWLGEYGLAQHYVEEMVMVARQPGLLSIVDSNLRILSKLEVYQGRYAEAIKTVEKSMATAREMASPWELFRLEIMGTAYRLLGKAAEAEQAYGACLAAAQARAYQPAIAESLLGLSALALDQGEYEQAERLLRQALAKWQQMHFAPGVARALVLRGHIGSCLRETGEVEARRCYAEALHLAIKHGLAPVALDALAGMAALQAQAGEMKQAYQLCTLAAAHPASTEEIRGRARKLLDRHPMEALPAEVSFAETSATDWQTAAIQVMADLRSSLR